MSTAITPFRIDIPDEADRRPQGAAGDDPLAARRRPSDLSYGQPVHFVRELADQWLNDYDWRKHEAELNRYPQFTTEIDGQTIHFIHVKSKRQDAFPLILTHGWPSTFYEFFKVIEPLTNPPEGEQAFDS